MDLKALLWGGASQRDMRSLREIWGPEEGRLGFLGSLPNGLRDLGSLLWGRGVPEGTRGP